MSERPQAEAAVLFDTDRVRSTRFDFAPGAQTGWHRHELDYVITMLTPATLRLENEDGTGGEATFAAGDSYHRAAGVRHNVINGGSEPIAFIELELK